MNIKNYDQRGMVSNVLQFKTVQWTEGVQFPAWTAVRKPFKDMLVIDTSSLGEISVVVK